MRGARAILELAIVVGIASHAAQAADEYRLLQLDGQYVKWGKPDLGTGAKVRYAFVSKPTRFSDARNCQAMKPVDSVLTTAKIEPAAFKAEVAAAFALWEQAANITFDAVADDARADIIIGVQSEPRGWAYADVSHADGGRAGTSSIDRALICLNPTRSWKMDFDGDMGVYELRVAIAHEIGHAIGLAHPGPRGQMMSFQYSESFRYLQDGDLDGVVALYGKKSSPIAALPTLPKTGAALLSVSK
ncbi:MAG: matrixin family metalloprotease [Alphaproteobacteria bacterium]|nr:matrixin family metalloprotease [Alphaproteobacteria bacterium]